MELRGTRRSKRLSSISTSSPQPPSPALRKRKEQSSDQTSRTPPKKKVRFSDPGPRLQNDPNCSTTGLTPALVRTSFEESDAAQADSVTQTPTRRSRRRRSTPLPRSRRSREPSLPFIEGSADRVVQFTPLRQILDPRAQRRICRTGLSDEINHIQREKRQAAHYEKSLQSLLQERDALRHELEAAKRDNDGSEVSTIRDEELLSPPASFEQLEFENNILKEQISSKNGNPDDHSSIASNGDGDTMILNDSTFEGDTFLVSDSPDIRGIKDGQHPVADDLSVLSCGNSTDASIQAQLPDIIHDTEINALSRDLEAARKEKLDLFDACRTRIPFSALEGAAISNSLRQLSPPPDFLEQVFTTLTAALARASDATSALDSVRQELSTLGFPGSNVDDIVSEMRTRFRSARLELERVVPGETADVSLNDGNATLSALVKRVDLLVQNLDEERGLHDSSLGREKALKDQFDNLLARYEAASKKIHDLEDSITSSAGDMLHTRMRMQDMEREGKEQAVGIERLNAALFKYREEVKSLENLVTGLEEDKTTCKETYCQKVSELEGKVADEEKARRFAETSVTEHETRIRELEQTVEQNRIRAGDLTAQMESLEKERQRVVEGLEQDAAQQLQHYEHEIGSMNVQVSELTTSLVDAKSEAERLRLSNAGLEEQLQLEIEARDNLLDRWSEEQMRSFAFMKETVNAERRKAKVRTANWEMKSGDPQSDNGNLGSEPITPVSMTRFVDVGVGRGKQRKRLDSGIGILTSDGPLEDDEGNQTTTSDILLPSDPVNL
ncbi:hypothetical protein ASPWEDRAFT_40827 [Aspergillus wentii DTO 134E9]|uniref:Uncharacterized protein n=1 Tax=Aspergillus wentii DTO 134E9 TaxID=1073089 RepID=A0A1L9RL17_ASPWE|nr:uncharacterized protein ASPWEDRAFT_40827 [Aspergillus wentii DTO 134E9]KAI9924628.1 hypothetical protein MW887_006902 [Aspergillus wentii]OJJ35611.1 hypothetical protein ASPWEDRAFT_40827 [Aspergillus wentii DTO 134E9]